MPPKTFIEIPNLKSFGYGICYFNKRNTFYVSSEVFLLLKENKMDRLDYMVLSYTHTQKLIEDVCDEIIEELKNCPPGPMSMEDIQKHLNKKNIFINPQYIVSPLKPEKS